MWLEPAVSASSVPDRDAVSPATRVSNSYVCDLGLSASSGPPRPILEPSGSCLEWTAIRHRTLRGHPGAGRQGSRWSRQPGSGRARAELVDAVHASAAATASLTVTDHRTTTSATHSTAKTLATDLRSDGLIETADPSP